MPDREQILAGLTRAAGDGLPWAIVWHLIVAMAIIAVAAGWRPSNRWAGVLLAAPLVSVSASSWAVHNPFNGSVFAALAIALMALATAFGDRFRVSSGARWTHVMGAGLVAFGWFYPHFLPSHSPIYYLFAAPLGLIPCPTLSMVVGVALLVRGIRNRAWSWTLAAAAAFYALFGLARLGVWIDVVLLAGAAALFAATARPARSDSDRSHTALLAH